MRTALLASIAAGALAVATSANAADLPLAPAVKAPPPPIFSWSGCYVGGHVGWGWSKPSLSNFPTVAATTTIFTPSASFGIKSSGSLFGGQLSCDYEFDRNFVVGIVGSGSAANLSGFADAPLGALLQSKTDLLADVSGRLGVTWGTVLAYLKGGGAWAHDSIALSFVTGARTASGGLAGGGIEWTFAQNWSGFVEYDHYFLRDGTVTFIGPPTALAGVNSAKLSQSIDAVKAGVNYRFRLW
jgi:outer membrane immunogenic protein